MAMDATDVIQRDLGRLEGTVAAQGERMKLIDSKMDAQTALLHEIKADLKGERAARKARSALALGGASFLGWAVSLAFDWWKTKP